MTIRKNYIDDNYESLEFVFNEISLTDDITSVRLHFEAQEDDGGIEPSV